MLEIDVFTLFPDALGWLAQTRPLRNACEAGSLRLRTIDLREFGIGGYRQVDDAPYGGGAGMLIRVDVVCAALESTYEAPVERVLAAAAGGGADAGRPPADRRRRRRAGRRRAADARVRPLRGLRPARARPPGQRPALDRPLRAVRRRAGRRGGGGRRLPQAARRAGQARRATWSSRSRPSSRAGSSIRTTRAPSSSAAGRCPPVLLSGHHAEIEQWRRRLSASVPADAAPTPG